LNRGTWSDYYLAFVINVFIPVIILTQLSDERYLGPLNGFLLALSFPVVSGLYSFYKQKQKNINFFSVIAIMGGLLTAAIGVFALSSEWVAIKEAAVPAIIGIGIILSSRTQFPLLEKLLKNNIDGEKVLKALNERETTEAFDYLVQKTTILFSFAFFVSAILNYVVAKFMIVNQPGTAKFNEEFGRMIVISYPAIAVPMLGIMGLAFLYFINGIKNLTGLKREDIISISKQPSPNTITPIFVSNKGPRKPTRDLLQEDFSSLKSWFINAVRYLFQDIFTAFSAGATTGNGIAWLIGGAFWGFSLYSAGSFSLLLGLFVWFVFTIITAIVCALALGVVFGAVMVIFRMLKAIVTIPYDLWVRNRVGGEKTG